MKIMLIDDSEWVHSFVRLYLLGKKDITLVTVTDAYEAIKTLSAQQDVDAIILDFHMPKITGLQFLQRMEGMITSKRIPVILSSTAELKGEVAECMKHGATAYLKKPYKPEALFSKLQELATLH